MSKLKTTTSVFLLFFVIIQSNAFADHRFDKRFEKRMQKLTYSIEDGFYHGDFNYHELKKLFKTQQNVEHLSEKFINDGRYSHKERRILTRRLDKFDYMIDRMRQNQKKYRYAQRYERSKNQQKWRFDHNNHSS